LAHGIIIRRAPSFIFGKSFNAQVSPKTVLEALEKDVGKLNNDLDLMLITAAKKDCL
jgi:hypothetical protein